MASFSYKPKETSMQMNDFSNLSDVCVLAVSFHPGLTQIKASSGLTGTDRRHASRCSPSLPCKLVFASHLCLSACSWSALRCSRCSWAWAACRLSLLCSTCSCSSTLMLRSCTLCALVFACSVFSCWILDSSLGKKKKKGGGRKGYSLILTVRRSSIPAPTSFCLLRVFSKSCSRTFSISSSCPLCFCFMLS